jgi:hypothetical protein
MAANKFLSISIESRQIIAAQLPALAYFYQRKRSGFLLKDDWNFQSG